VEIVRKKIGITPFPYEVVKSDAKVMLQHVHNHYWITYSNEVKELATFYVHLDGLPQMNSQKQLQSIHFWALVY